MVAYCHRPGPVRITQSQMVRAFTEFPNRDPRTASDDNCRVYLMVLGTPRVPTKFWVPQQDSVHRQLAFAGYPTGTQKVLGAPAGLCPQTANIRWVPHGYPQSSGSPSRSPQYTIHWPGFGTARCRSLSLSALTGGRPGIYSRPTVKTYMYMHSRHCSWLSSATHGDCRRPEHYLHCHWLYSTAYNTVGCTARLCL